jgi:hypothetical protein
MKNFLLGAAAFGAFYLVSISSTDIHSKRIMIAIFAALIVSLHIYSKYLKIGRLEKSDFYLTIPTILLVIYFF